MNADRRRILLATMAALLAAAAILVTVVLPAEYGVDPLGTGERLGLVALSGGQYGGASAGVLTKQPSEFRRNRVSFVLGPYEALEYKYRIEQGGAVVYSWRANGELIYDFHAEPDGAPKGYAESFDKQRATQDNGTYHAPFSGIHGWYWENPGRTTITLNLITSGFYSQAIEFRDGDVGEHPLEPID